MYYGQPPPNQQPQNQQPNQPQFPGTEYLKNVSPEMINFGLNAGQDILNKQRDKWMPGVSGFWNSLKYYFSVSNSYVINKLLLILNPIPTKVWNRVSAEEFERGETDQISRKWALPKNDINAPDLYIPLMSFITYVLLFGLYKGISMGTMFSPEVIINSIWRCILLGFVETGLIKFGSNLLSVPVPVLDIYSYTGYKYVVLCVNIIAIMLNTTLGYIISLYTACAIGYFILKNMATAIPPSNVTNGPTRHGVILGFGVSQFLIVLWFSMY